MEYTEEQKRTLSQITLEELESIDLSKFDDNGFDLEGEDFLGVLCIDFDFEECTSLHKSCDACPLNTPNSVREAIKYKKSN